ncbi:MAG TPA: nicotinamide riboside transporter PnuC [Spirochaetota bacterium]|nr:nicotinamide riboside transporter PnuC [Spirochaetota bacterium]HPJ36111.1 nicotinamide riboside transporter PnuC [Spirochaetota bacterium]
MNFFDINYILFQLPGYGVSAVEFIGTATGLLCVIYAAREKIISWPLGIVNAIFFFILFYQARLYPDMLLQIYFFATSVYGWWRWTHPRDELETDSKDELKVSRLENTELLAMTALTVAASILAGSAAERFHLWLPFIFPEPAAFPYADSFVAVMSVTAQILLSIKKLEAWILWVIVDAVAMTIYLQKGIYLVSAEYLVFGIIASSGLLNWNRIFSGYGAEAEAAE